MKLLNPECIAPEGERVYDFELHNCGFFKKIQTDIPTFRPKGREDYHVIIVAKGEVKIKLNGNCLTAKSGNIIFFPPDIPQIYTYLSGEDTDYCWLHFDGGLMGKFLEKFPFRMGIFEAQNIEKLNSIAEKIYNMNLTRQKGDAFLMNVLLGQLLILFGQAVFCKEKFSPLDKKTEEIKTRIEAAPEKEYDNKELAKECGVSEYHFIRIFKDKTGLAPMQYVISQRISKAKLLLRETDMTVSQVAFMCGFSDPLYFSRIYKNKVGVSPKKYREQ